MSYFLALNICIREIMW